MEHLFPKRISDEEYDQLDDEIKSLAISSEQTQMVNAEFTIAGFVEISDSGRSNARKVLLQHPSGALCEIYTKGASVASWSMPNGGDVLFTPELSDFSKESPKTCGLAYNFPNWDGFNLFDDMSTDTTTTTTTIMLSSIVVVVAMMKVIIPTTITMIMMKIITPTTIIIIALLLVRRMQKRREILTCALRILISSKQA